jgi:hypothetical protein
MAPLAERVLVVFCPSCHARHEGGGKLSSASDAAYTIPAREVDVENLPSVCPRCGADGVWVRWRSVEIPAG